METYMGTIQLFGLEFVPADFMPCDGRVLALTENTLLYTLLGNRFGGKAGTSFALPKIPAPTPGTQYCICINGVLPHPS